jgi:hypothetical protein
MLSQSLSARRARKWRAENPKKARVLMLRQYTKSRTWLDVLKAKPCMDCKQTFPTECMDFDHVRGKKLTPINTQTAHKSKGPLLEEIKKCDLVCSNCHRIRTRTRKLRR